MSRLRQMRKARRLSLQKVVDRMGFGAPDVPLLSHMESDHCNPTTDQFYYLCRALRCKPAELYDPEELDYGMRKTRKRAREDGIYKMTFRIPREAIDRMFGGSEGFHRAVRDFGYRDAEDWLLHRLAALQRSVERKKQRGEAVTDG